MPFPYVIDADAGIATVTLSGTVQGRDIAETMESVFRAFDWRPGFDILWDGSQITELLFEKDDLPSFVRVQQAFAHAAGDGCDIILVARKLDDVMAQMYTVLMRNQRRKVHVCRSASEARAIIGRDVESH
jgi:hypothetical protein